MLTIFSVPKPFSGPAALAQRNAIASWKLLGHGVQVVLVGDETGISEAAREHGIGLIPDVTRSEQGTPRLDDVFARVDAIAAHELRCFVNADIVLLADFLPAVAASRAAGHRFLMVGQTRDLAVDAELELTAAGGCDALAARALREGHLRGAAAIDYFVFTPGLFDPMPRFVVGRARFDNWLVWRARTRGPVIDATKGVVAVHQRHDYGHLAGGFREAYLGEEAMRNEELALAEGKIFTIHDASHALRADGSLRRNYGAVLRIRETLRKVAWKLVHASRSGDRSTRAPERTPPS